MPSPDFVYKRLRTEGPSFDLEGLKHPRVPMTCRRIEEAPPQRHSRNRELEAIKHRKVIDCTHHRPGVEGAVGTFLGKAGSLDGPASNNSVAIEGVHKGREWQQRKEATEGRGRERGWRQVGNRVPDEPPATLARSSQESITGRSKVHCGMNAGNM